MLKVNYFAADKCKSLTCRVFIKAETILVCLYAKFHKIYFQMIFYTILQYNSLKSSNVRYKSDVIQQDLEGKEIQFIAVLVDFESEMLFVSQPWWVTYSIGFVVIFVGKTHESFLKS